jgi:Fe-Mn family superoxide dismutase
MYTAKDFSSLLGMSGFSDTMLNNHFTLYKGYVDNSNKLITNLDKVEKGSQEYQELKRRLGWELNGIKLHELYFDNMCVGGKAMSDKIEELIVTNYKSVDEYFASLRRNGMIRGIGWVLLMQDSDTGNLYHVFVGEHNVGNVVNGKILMVMDCWEHAYMTDYGIKRADYIESFIANIDWSKVEARLA